MEKFRIYIDETGNPDLNSSDNPNHRFLTLTGIIVALDYVRKVLHPEMESIKNDILNQHPDNPIIFHRKEILNRKYPFEKLRNPKTLTLFNKTILKKLSNWEYKIITVLIDKKEHKEIYKVWRYDPYHYCLAVLLERYLFFLEEKKAVGDVMVESRGGKEDMRLKKSFRNLYNDGSEYIESLKFKSFLTSKELIVKPKIANINGLQLADLLAHPSRRNILLIYNLIKKEKEIFGDKIISVIQTKYYKRFNTLIGYGLKKLP
ncbi:MAG: DUF3800 domain-containing protein [Candidatus Cloacimonetes bacterium]|nr:DUF3800 domain-containing protein [Candidatus Cloacimonadota bacterium]MBL7149095.1 DUF3800 domain-containing protein [Candidatus Cloacimonadota bacterium]